MSETLDSVANVFVKNQDRAVAFMERMTQVAHTSAVYSEPVQSGEYTIITASEVTAGLGFGFGGGGGEGGEAGDEEEKGGEGVGMGGGGGGGGTVMSRPVAVISIGPEGVQVEPVVDPTKIALAFFTAIAGMVMALGRMRRVGRK